MTEIQIRIIHALRDGLPLVEEPFRVIAEKVGVTEGELLAQLEAWRSDGTIRRFGAVLRHHEAGFRVNAMGVWNVPATRVEEFARKATEHREISHCYQRPPFPGFPYNLYTMIHGHTREECEGTARSLSAETGITDFALLYTVREFKKSSPVYFGRMVDGQWESGS